MRLSSGCETATGPPPSLPAKSNSMLPLRCCPHRNTTALQPCAGELSDRPIGTRDTFDSGYLKIPVSAESPDNTVVFNISNFGSR